MCAVIHVIFQSQYPLYFIIVVNIICFVVKQSTVKDVKSGEKSAVTLPLSVNKLEKYADYNIEDEDPDIYSDDEDFGAGFSLRREWNDVELPSKVNTV